MLEAVLFDWGHTLMDFVWDEEYLVSGYRAGLESLGRELDVEAVVHRFREVYDELSAAEREGTLEELEYPGLVRRLLGELGIEPSEEELARYLEAEHAEWAPARRLGATTHALLDSLRRRDLRLGLVSNTFDPGWLLRRDLEEQGLAERLDVAVFSSEVGRRKPDPAIYRAALAPLGVEPERALFVGDRLVEDVRGPAELGMTTVQALWFRAEDARDGIEPDYQAFTQMDVLNVVRRLIGET